ncbi:hypothetical protein [Enterococcus gallinarum]|uniref:hypothetical protein n=1 Tax=Enterococcus gallinarum TaxID=1353 RepID=UPI0018ABC3B5|nr:hypothetical protein [Enterococcus gallinarum]
MSTRELAILYWILFLLFLVVLFRKKDILISLRSLVKTTTDFLLSPISIVIIVVNIIYLCIIYYLSYNNNLNISLWYIKDYAIVIIFSIYPIVAYLKKLKFKTLISEKKKELFGFAVVPLFINSTYTFPVIGEMLLIFLLTTVSIIIAVTERDKETEIVAKIFSFILTMLSLFMICSAILKFASNIDDIFSLDFWLSFSLESVVWIINLPIIFLVREMVYVEKKAIFSDHKNRIYTYIKYGIILLKNRMKYKKYRNFDVYASNYIEEAKELASIAGGRIYIRLNENELSQEILLAIMSDAIMGKNKITGIKNQRGKYPNIVEIRNKNGDWYAFWQDSFVSKKYKDNRVDTVKTVELLGGIRLVQD